MATKNLIRRRQAIRDGDRVSYIGKDDDGNPITIYGKVKCMCRDGIKLTLELESDQSEYIADLTKMLLLKEDDAG